MSKTPPPQVVTLGHRPPGPSERHPVVPPSGTGVVRPDAVPEAIPWEADTGVQETQPGSTPTIGEVYHLLKSVQADQRLIRTSLQEQGTEIASLKSQLAEAVRIFREAQIPLVEVGDINVAVETVGDEDPDL